jgi:hypothetical protein
MPQDCREQSRLTAMDGGNAARLQGAIAADCHGWWKCRKIAWSNRGHPISVDDVGKMQKMHSHPGRLYNQA